MQSSTSSPQIATCSSIPSTKILLVEDNEMGRQMVRTLLEHLHLQVIEAVDGADALAKIAAADFALVLMDIQMPVMDGITAAKAIRRLEQPQKANVPIIAMTAYMEIEIEQQFDSASFNGCVSKPIELEKLYHQLQRFLPDLSQATSVAPVCEDNCSALRHALPQINVTAALRRSGNDVELYRNLLQKFYVQFSPSSNKLQHKIDTQDYRAARFIAHDLKGAAGTLGAEEMQQCANELEQQLANEQPPAALAATQLALQNFLALIQALDSGEEQKNSSATTEVPAGSCTQLHSLLCEMRVPLARLQVKQINKVRAQLAQKQWPEVFTAQLQQLIAHLDNYQFAPASELLEGLLSICLAAQANETKND